MRLIGSEHHAYIKRGNHLEPAEWCYYGGWVCSEPCDRMACLRLEQSMPGHGPSQRSLLGHVEYALKRKWMRHHEEESHRG